MTIKTLLNATKTAALAVLHSRAMAVAIGDARVRSVIGAAVSAVLAITGLTVSPEAVGTIVVAGGLLAGLGPHQPLDGATA